MRLIPLVAFLVCSFIALSCSSTGSDNSVSNSSVNNADVANNRFGMKLHGRVLGAQGQPKPDTISIEDWFPPEVRSQGDLGGEMTLKGDAYPAGDLLQPPYTEGKVSRVANSNFFVVQLTAK